ncbi:hypothetical protein SLW70_16060 [Flavobacterium sp. NG2]|uniref:hypothetical protein n=1 Tax=Flavobacterium sp. NG2 TaxID=3097547 RepID=UPI002A82C4E4|nr:hypothetical protein [Flavobacterium sp. NG2]WPR71429.1 hypothetical protein SLW70_16060 [Flavobacterium sp. NG2]
MKKVGIWIDKKNAKIVSIGSGSESFETIESQVEDFHIGGGSGTKFKGGPQDVVQDSKYLEREKHQLADYFKDVMKNIADAEAIVVFGPAQTGEKLYKELLDKHSQFQHKKIAVEKADSMTDNQVKAWVRNYYTSDK